MLAVLSRSQQADGEEILRVKGLAVERHRQMFANKCMNGATGMSDIEGKATRAGASERGKQTSFKAIKVITSSSRKTSTGDRRHQISLRS